MSGLGISLYTDEDVDERLADQLGRQGYDILSCRAAGNHNKQLPDDWQLAFAVSQQRAILVNNIADYMSRDEDWRARGREHYGIVLAEKRIPIGELVRRTKRHLDTISPSYQHNLVLHLPS